jgi:hypothetical protein
VVLAIGALRSLGILTRSLGSFMPWITVGALLIVAYTLLLRGRAYLDHFDRFNARPRRYRKCTTIASWTYMLLSYLLPVVFFFAMAAAGRP